MGKLILLLLLGIAVYFTGAGLDLYNPSVVFDVLTNLGSNTVENKLRAGPGRHLVVLQHGLWRSAHSLGRLERALRDHGYDVLNESYPSTQERIEVHAERLAQRIRSYLASGEPPRSIAFAGHSMGGLVIRSYLARADAVPANACVFLGTPHGGSVLASKRQGLWLFKAVMGKQAALQLRPEDGFWSSALPVPSCPFGNILGAKGDAEGHNRDIPGDDDGTVATREAHLSGEADAIELPLGHTSLSFAAPAIHQVLFFLSNHRFDHQ